ncbi:glucosaminidase domain-containing protein [Gayadomonas joobiniege]|uniref:glucosaminidase domain-containing protein n=1 Tax=Gayadomonas joobiniege TaxID=1234606 RepID=UPI0003775307|nr:glucosaminidase domain-containing protein [Gayadomonas joobiniege]
MLNKLIYWISAVLFFAALIYPFFVPYQQPKVATSDVGSESSFIPPVKPLKVKFVHIKTPLRAHQLTAHPAPNFSKIKSVKVRKAAFFKYFISLAQLHNDWIKQNREFVLLLREALAQKKRLSLKNIRHLAYLTQRYRLPQSLLTGDSAHFEQLLSRLDEVPIELVLIQAAKESGWGRSRFARQGHNYFGKWCFKKGCGMVPQQRPEHLSHEVSQYASPLASLQDYYLTVNTNQNYQLLRNLRDEFRRIGVPPRAEVLAAGLLNYSERGVDYVEEIILMIRNNQQLIDELVDELARNTSAAPAEQGVLNIYERPNLLNKSLLGN